MTDREHYRDEAVLSLRNRCDIYFVLRNVGKEDLCKTLLEDIGYFAQGILDEYCVIEETTNTYTGGNL